MSDKTTDKTTEKMVEKLGEIATKNEIAKYLKIVPSTISKRCWKTRRGNDDFPLPFTDGERRCLWRTRDIAQWVDNRMTQVQEKYNIPTNPNLCINEKEKEKEKIRKAEVARKNLKKMGVKIVE
ncbi:MAG: hypothetical protein LBC74_09010 [Planctomycetaceae bacterium]|jgi:predicted DNA-binding transcriptional regulator AlpA|nr:hypothetical protein [Planctomycetaceae bacterium]